jgi:hypothetical protein
MQDDFGEKVSDNKVASALSYQRSSSPLLFDWQQIRQDRARMEERNERIPKNKLQRRGIVEDDESYGEKDDFGSDLSPNFKRSKTPYRRLTMQEPFTTYPAQRG